MESDIYIIIPTHVTLQELSGLVVMNVRLKRKVFFMPLMLSQIFVNHLSSSWSFLIQ